MTRKFLKSLGLSSEVEEAIMERYLEKKSEKDARISELEEANKKYTEDLKELTTAKEAAKNAGKLADDLKKVTADFEAYKKGVERMAGNTRQAHQRQPRKA